MLTSAHYTIKEHPHISAQRTPLDNLKNTPRHSCDMCTGGRRGGEGHSAQLSDRQKWAGSLRWPVDFGTTAENFENFDLKNHKKIDSRSENLVSPSKNFRKIFGKCHFSQKG